MENEWTIKVPQHECPWAQLYDGELACLHEENSTYCSYDYCPIKEEKLPPGIPWKGFKIF